MGVSDKRRKEGEGCVCLTDTSGQADTGPLSQQWVLQHLPFKMTGCTPAIPVREPRNGRLSGSSASRTKRAELPKEIWLRKCRTRRPGPCRNDSSSSSFEGEVERDEVLEHCRHLWVCYAATCQALLYQQEDSKITPAVNRPPASGGRNTVTHTTVPVQRRDRVVPLFFPEVCLPNACLQGTGEDSEFDRSPRLAGIAAAPAHL